jgi:phage-related protein
VAWHVEVLDRRVERELDDLAEDVRQRSLRIVELIEKHGIAAMHEPHTKHLAGKLWEMHMKGKDGIVRAIETARVRAKEVV